MFLKKIKSIDNVGSFYKYDGRSFEFKKTNLIFGLNGHGKTTLTTILKSLRENQPDLIIGRKSLNSTAIDEQGVILEFTDNGTEKTIRFDRSIWKEGASGIANKNPFIVIFDDEFISNNIFAEKFEIDHKKALYKIIFGKDGIALSKEIKKLTEEKKVLLKEHKEASEKISTSFYETKDFLKLDIATLNQQQIQDSLEAINKQIKNFGDQEKIQKKAIFQRVQAEVFEFNALAKLLLGKINSSAHNEATLKIEQFKKDFFIQEDGVEGFLKFGYSHKKSSCPFCHKPLDDTHLLETYKNFFDESYTSFLDDLKKESAKFAKWNIEAVFQKIENTIKSNTELFAAWKEILPEVSNLNIFDFDFGAKLILHARLSELIQEKIQNLNSDIITPVAIDEYRHTLAALGAQMESYNAVVDITNKQILQFKESLGKTDFKELEKQKNKLSDEQKRLEPSVNALCQRIAKIVEDGTLKKKEIDDKQAELNRYSESIKNEYLEIINKKLSENLGVDYFRLVAIEEKASGNATEAFLEIYLEILSNKIALHDFKDDKPSFKNTLSKGDKNSLAFAFFLAFMEKKENKDKTILIFDDPLSSHDENRQDATATAIRALAEEVSQTFILTHKKEFLRSIHSKVKGQPSFGSFEINKTSATGSKISQFDIHNFLKREFEKIIDKLQKYTEEGSSAVSIGNLLNDIRKIFEHALRTKYYALLKNEPRPLMSFNTINENFFNQGCLLSIKDRLIEIAQLSNDGSHDTYEHLNEEEIKQTIKKALKLLEEI
ncbi:MAG: AAA family ATPase [Campylobacterales bacterium]